MVSVLASSAIDCGYELRSCQTKEYKIGICCFSAKNAALRRKSKDWLARNQNNVSEWSDISTQWLLLAHPAKGKVSFYHHLVAVVRCLSFVVYRPLTNHILIFFLANLVKGNMSFCHHLVSVVCRLSSVYFSHFNLLLWNASTKWCET